MSIARTWLLICVAASACSSRTTGEAPNATETKPAPAAPATAPAADERYDSGALGALTFELTEGNAEARAHFMRGLLALHSFWYDEATRQFQAAIAADATMNMAHWGLAMSYLKLLWGDDDLTAAKRALSKMPNPDLLSPREQAWVMATIELVRAGDVRTSRQRFAAAIEALHAQFPDDESATFLAVALLATTRPEDPDTVAVRKRAAALAQAVFEHNPKHPGAAHYLIHAYDTSELAALALPQARAYAKLAPAAFHARHMPAHIFSRLGMWQDAITSCQAAWDASVAAAKREKLSASHYDFHSLNWLIEMNFELGKRKAADAALDLFARTVRAGLDHQQRTLYATQIASYMRRTGEWSRVDELLAPLEAPADEAPGAAGPMPTANAAASAAGPAPTGARAGEPATHCAPVPASSPLELMEQRAVLDARLRAAARQRDLAGTKRLLGEMDALRTKLRPFFLTMQPAEAVAKLDAAHVRRTKALLARAAGNDRALLTLLRRAGGEAAAEAGGESNPSGFVPAEEIADTLLGLGKLKEAAAAYAGVLEQHPGRAHAILRAARAATKLGDVRAARASYELLLQQWAAADENIDGLAEARTAVTAPSP